MSDLFSIELEKQASQTGLPTVKNVKQNSCHPQQIHGTHFFTLHSTLFSFDSVLMFYFIFL